jgi:signal recognition particle GTPase
MVKVDLITGFLGSGKTTFIKKYAQYLIKDIELELLKTILVQLMLI